MTSITNIYTDICNKITKYTSDRQSYTEVSSGDWLVVCKHCLLLSAALFVYFPSRIQVPYTNCLASLLLVGCPLLPARNCAWITTSEASSGSCKTRTN